MTKEILTTAGRAYAEAHPELRVSRVALIGAPDWPQDYVNAAVKVINAEATKPWAADRHEPCKGGRS